MKAYPEKAEEIITTWERIAMNGGSVGQEAVRAMRAAIQEQPEKAAEIMGKLRLLAQERNFGGPRNSVREEAVAALREAIQEHPEKAAGIVSTSYFGLRLELVEALYEGFAKYPQKAEQLSAALQSCAMDVQQRYGGVRHYAVDALCSASKKYPKNADVINRALQNLAKDPTNGDVKDHAAYALEQLTQSITELLIAAENGLNPEERLDAVKGLLAAMKAYPEKAEEIITTWERIAMNGGSVGQEAVRAMRAAIQEQPEKAAEIMGKLRLLAQERNFGGPRNSVREEAVAALREAIQEHPEKAAGIVSTSYFGLRLELVEALYEGFAKYPQKAEQLSAALQSCAMDVQQRYGGVRRAVVEYLYSASLEYPENADVINKALQNLAKDSFWPDVKSHARRALELLGISVEERGMNTFGVDGGEAE